MSPKRNKSSDFFLSQEISWIAFNERVLQEAEDRSVPLIERMRFLGIFSNNLDEFLRVRYANINRLAKSKIDLPDYLNAQGVASAEHIIEDIGDRISALQAKMDMLYEQFTQELRSLDIFIINENQILEEHREFIEKYFYDHVSPDLTILVINDRVSVTKRLRDEEFYLATHLTNSEKQTEIHALIEVPVDSCGRFVKLPAVGGKTYIMFLEDVIRFNLSRVFSTIEYDAIESYTIKFARDAEMNLDSDFSRSLVQKIEDSLGEREIASPTYFIYDREMPKELLDTILKNFGGVREHSILKGGRYHNRKDLMQFPNPVGSSLEYPKLPPLPIRDLNIQKSLIDQIENKDYLICTPYHSLIYIVKLLREAAIDPEVEEIMITTYRVAKRSRILNALINAARNGKKITILIELTARFDEHANLNWADVLKKEGIEVLFGPKDMKVHSKICTILRKNKPAIGFVSTGNFNENSARIYSDFTLLTAHKEICSDIAKTFQFLEYNYLRPNYQSLLLAPHDLLKTMMQLIDKEIKNKKHGKPAFINLKMNNITSHNIIRHLYKAAEAGVKIRIITRGMHALNPDLPELKGNIEMISIVDKYLEHGRMYHFCHGGKDKMYISSADFMKRNLQKRTEAACPIYDTVIIQELIDVFEMQWRDNTKARILCSDMKNNYRTGAENEPEYRAQVDIYEYYK